MSILSWFLGSGAADAPPPPAPPPPPPPSDNGVDIAAALRAAAPRADLDLWVPILTEHFPAVGITTPYRVAAFIGQATAEVGDDWSELAENTNYTSPARLLAVFPDEFNAAQARDYAGRPVAIANRAYAHKLGNGDEASGDGYHFRGSGLFQLTGRAEIGGFASTIGMTPEAAADYCRAPLGAVVSACWYWDTRGLGDLADAGMWSAITRRLNGAAMEGADVRLACTRRALSAQGVG